MSHVGSRTSDPRVHMDNPNAFPVLWPATSSAAVVCVRSAECLLARTQNRIPFTMNFPHSLCFLRGTSLHQMETLSAPSGIFTLVFDTVSAEPIISRNAKSKTIRDMTGQSFPILRSCLIPNGMADSSPLDCEFWFQIQARPYSGWTFSVN